MANFHHHFLLNTAETMCPLYNALHGKPKDLKWNLDMQAVFVNVKIVLARATTLSFPTGLHSNKSSRAHPKTLSFSSMKLSKAELNYSTFDRELIAINYAVRHFRRLLEGTSIINTNHQPMLHAFTKQQAAWTNIKSFKWQDVPLDDKNTILYDISTGRPPPLIPAAFQRLVFITDTGSFHEPRRRFVHNHINAVGPFSPSEGHRYHFTAVDRSTRWLEAIPMKDTTAFSCITALLFRWTARISLSEQITSDRGTSFTSRLWQDLAELLGTTALHTTSYSPAVIAIKDDYNVPSAEMIIGQQLVVSAEFFPPQESSESLQQLRQTVDNFASCVATHHREVKTDVHTPPLTKPYTGSRLVLKRKDKTFHISVFGKPGWVSIDRLKPAHLEYQRHCPSNSRERDVL
ncbi:uncharacterized protein LOC143020162 [Oratosquilla oratoria]|uniref:uncharacterized protein LOC143020162 n=1 Tax=Oratosquilla oratoria TaxID=337810 RepID=UPI003F75EA0F